MNDKTKITKTITKPKPNPLKDHSLVEYSGRNEVRDPAGLPLKWEKGSVYILPDAVAAIYQNRSNFSVKGAK